MTNPNDVKKYTQNLSILFVEDHDELRVNTDEILSQLFKTADSCNNGKDALNMYKSFNEKHSKNYDIVLSDIQMPMMDGIKLTEEIYRINPSQIIIILSAYDESKYLLKLINVGIEQFIKKPIDYNELLAAFINSTKRINNSDTLNINSSSVQLSKDISYSKDSKSLVDGNKDIYLTKFEIIFIELLLSSVGKIYSNENIVQHYISLGENIDATNIRKLVSKLRKKLPKDALESIYAVGYKFIPYNP